MLRSRSTGFGSGPNDSAHFLYAAPCNSKLLRAFAFASAPLRIEISLAVEANSPPRFSKRTIRHCSAFRKFLPYGSSFQKLHSFRAVSDDDQLVSGSFHLLPKMLFNIPSQYYCAIGLATCLGLALDRAIFVLHIRGALLYEQLQLAVLRIRAFHPLRGLFPEAFA